MTANRSNSRARDPSRGANPTFVTHVFLIWLVAAILANGAYFWLQKSQLVPSPAWEAYLAAVQLAEANPSVEYPEFKLDGFYVVPGPWILTKLLKDGFVLAFAAVSLLYLRRATPVWSRALIAPAFLGMIIAAASLHSLQAFGPWVAASGLRWVAYLGAGLIGLWLTKPASFRLLAHYLLVALVIELALALYESSYGMPLFMTGRLGNRAVGTFSFPSSLGIFAVVVATLAFSFTTVSRLFIAFLTVAVVYLTGSATAIVLLGVALAMWVVHAVPDKWQATARVSSIALLAASILALPNLTARHDVFDSFWGRIEPAADYIEHRPSLTGVLFGKGLGIGSNVLGSAIVQTAVVEEPAEIDLYHARSDSTPLALINQVGLAGTALFYLMVALAAWRDRKAMPTYVIMVLAGLTTNLLELFPVNFLMGLLLSRSLLARRQDIRFESESTTIGAKPTSS